jgi:hypothetical protein
MREYEKAKEQWILALELKPNFKTANLNLKHLEKIESNMNRVIL